MLSFAQVEWKQTTTHLLLDRLGPEPRHVDYVFDHNPSFENLTLFSWSLSPRPTAIVRRRRDMFLWNIWTCIYVRPTPWFHRCLLLSSRKLSIFYDCLCSNMSSSSYAWYIGVVSIYEHLSPNQWNFWCIHTPRLTRLYFEQVEYLLLNGSFLYNRLYDYLVGTLMRVGSRGSLAVEEDHYVFVVIL